MAWTAPMTAVANTAFTAAQFNTHVRDNLLETAPAKATTEGSYFIGDGTNSIVERSWDFDFVEATASTSSTSFTDLGGSSGPTVTVTTGPRALVFLTANLFSQTTNGTAVMGFEVTGASSIAASDNNALAFESGDSAFITISQASVCVPLDNLTPGVNTFTSKYRGVASPPSGTCVFRRRRITVLPY